MFGALFGSADPTAPNFHSVTTNVPDSDLFGPLEPKDTEWLCAGGFITETQTWYTTKEDGTVLMVQVIHSSVGLWYPTVTFNYKISNPKTGENTWKSVNVTNFITPPAGLDKRSCKADQFTIVYKPKPGTDFPESYLINANLGTDLQVSLEVTRPASVPGWKLGKGEKGGYSYYGPDLQKPEGYMVHRFWPRTKVEGHIISSGKANTIAGSGIFIHAIQGMRPNLTASAWNFHNFQSTELGGVSAIQMEFTTCDSHGKKGSGSGPVKVNVGSLVINNKLVAVTAETKWRGEAQSDKVISRTTHLDSIRDDDTGYKKPSRLTAQWKGPSIVSEAPGTLEASLEMDVGDVKNPRGLIEKVDIMAEIPTFLKAAVSYVAGTKPYMYQWVNPVKLHLSGPEDIASGLSNGVDVEGHLYTEATFISLTDKDVNN